MILKTATKEIMEVGIINASVLGITTLTELETLLKITLLVLTLLYTADKYYYHRKGRKKK